MTSNESITARALRSLLWVVSGMGIVGTLRLVNLMILARLLGPEAFGLMSAALVVVGMSHIVSDMGVGYALIQRPQLGEREFRTAITVSFLTGLAIYGLVWVIAEPVGAFFGQPLLPDLLKGLALAFPLRSISVPADAVFQRELAFATVARVDVAAYTIGYFAVSIVLALSGYQVWALGGAFLGEAIVRTALLVYLSPYRLRPALDRDLLASLLHFGAGVSLTRVANFVALQADKIIVGRLLGTVTLGAYERAYQLMVMPANLLGQVVGRVLFPAVARIQENPESVRVNYRRSLGLTALVTLPLSVLIVVLDRELVNLILGKGWSEAVPAFGILGAVLLFRASYKISGELVRACGAIYAEAWRQLVYAAAVFAGGIIGARWGLPGVSLGVALAIVLNFVLMTDLGRRLTGLGWADVLAAHRPALLLTVIAGVACTVGERVARSLFLGDLLTVFASVGLAGGAVLAALARWPRLLGQDADWLLEALRSHAPPPLARLLPQRREAG